MKLALPSAAGRLLLSFRALIIFRTHPHSIVARQTRARSRIAGSGVARAPRPRPDVRPDPEGGRNDGTAAIWARAAAIERIAACSCANAIEETV